MLRSLLTALTLVVLWTLVSLVNHELTGTHVSLFVGGLFVAYAALVLPHTAGLAAVLLGGLVCDAQAPVAFGAQAFLFAAAHAVVYHLRDRLPRDDTVGRVVIALLTNLALFLVFSFGQIGAAPTPAAAWPRLLVDLLCSQVFLALIGPWFFAFQSHTLVLFGAEPLRRV